MANDFQPSGSFIGFFAKLPELAVKSVLAVVVYIYSSYRHTRIGAILVRLWHQRPKLVGIFRLDQFEVI